MLRPIRWLKWALLAIPALVLVVACGGPAQQSQPVAPEQRRTVETALGEVVVPQSPQRVVVLAQSALDNTLALGVKPVASTYAGFSQRSDYGNFPDYLANKIIHISLICSNLE